MFNSYKMLAVLIVTALLVLPACSKKESAPAAEVQEEVTEAAPAAEAAPAPVEQAPAAAGEAAPAEAAEQ